MTELLTPCDAVFASKASTADGIRDNHQINTQVNDMIRIGNGHASKYYWVRKHAVVARYLGW